MSTQTHTVLVTNSKDKIIHGLVCDYHLEEAKNLSNNKIIVLPALL